jgi:selenocysteine-specific elongation factor
MRVIGTAGHVDHGKSTLVEALTGTHPDRLKEEREREMTIDLGFAYLTLPDGEEVGIVDVPGHRDFIENMLAGIGGIDAALFVVAADEGVMPQTREHLAILDLLQIPTGVIALTKIDLVEDPEWLDLVAEDVRSTVAGTVLGSAPLVRVSARTKKGIPELLSALGECLEARPPRPDIGRPRLPVDRVFTIPGFGTVVTGTLIDGHLEVGEDVEVLPAGHRGRIRGLQAHKHSVAKASPGGRTAINLSGLSVEQICRGDVVVHPGDYHPTRRLDVHFRLLPDVGRPLKHNTEVKLFLGSKEVIARVRLLGVKQLSPGDQVWLQLETREPVVSVHGDRYILRIPSPPMTIGGGVVVDPHPKGRHKRFSDAVLSRLEALLQGTPEDVLLQAVHSLGMASVQQVIDSTTLSQEEAFPVLERLVSEGELFLLQQPFSSVAMITTPNHWTEVSRRMLETLEGYHRKNPLRTGMPREELKSRLRLSTREFNAVLSRLVEEGVLVEAGPLMSLATHEVRFTAEQREQVERLLAEFQASPFSPPTVKACVQAVGEAIYTAMVDLGYLVPVSEEVVFRREDYQNMRQQVIDWFASHPTLTVAELRDRWGTSRRYVLAFLEHLDAAGVTIREGDVRRLRSAHKH